MNESATNFIITHLQDVPEKDPPARMNGGYRHIGLMLESQSGYRDKILNGISRHARQQTNWRIAFFDRERKDLADLVGSWKGDGIICTAVDSRFAEAAATRDIPVINVTSQYTDPVFLNVIGDNHAAGATAAEYLLSRGFASFAFVRQKGGSRFSTDRGKGFGDVVAAAGHGVETIAVGSAGDGELVEKLAPLPRPLAVLGATDRLATMTLEACWHLGLRVPEEVAVLGIGNYDQLCELCSPTLSSLDIDMERRGLEAAKWLDRLLEGEPRPEAVDFIPPLHVAERRSTDVYAFDDPDVVAALRFIRYNAAKTIKVRDVVGATTISRRSLEGRFNKYIGRTLHDEIWKAHFDVATRLLVSSDLSLQEVAERSGFRTASALVNLFRQRFDMTPKEYRIANRR